MTSHTVEAVRSESIIEDTATGLEEEITRRDVPSEPYARCIAASQRVRWQIDKDVIRGRTFNVQQKFLPDGLSRVHELEFLTTEEKRYLSQIQGRTYAHIFHMAERFVNAKVLEISRDHTLGNQTALEALVRLAMRN